MKTYSQDELAVANGKDGAGTLVAVDGTVYDISDSKKWIHGKHMNRHTAGKDMSAEIIAAPHGKEVLKRFEIVGLYQKEPPEQIPGLKGKVDAWLDEHPILRRHPHPAVVHVPIGLMVTLPLFEVAALVTGSTATEWAAYLCLILGLVSLPAAMATGYLTWWINYDWKDASTIRWKRRLAWTALPVALIAVIWRALLISDPIVWSDTRVMIYCAITLALGCLVPLIGFLGGTLTFPYEKS
jgi:predicted heme/steroid binding protein/uncharacterized membrane protein